MIEKEFVELTKKYEQLKKELKETRDKLVPLMSELGLNTYIQDPLDGTVFKIVEPKGTFVEFRKIDYVRTAREDESRGDLSKKEASDNGFILRK
jgi:hypothetical protein